MTKILIIEDEIAIRNVLKNILQDENKNFIIHEDAEFEVSESEDTISILNRYIEEAEINLDKSVVQKIMHEIYREACEQI